MGFSMMNKIQALNSFWSRFGLIAYDETHVPDYAEMPYITYETVSDSFGNTVAGSASLWYRTESWSEITQKELEIAEVITKGGMLVPYEGGAFWIKRGQPWAQRLADDTDSVRRIILNVELEFLSQD